MKFKRLCTIKFLVIIGSFICNSGHATADTLRDAVDQAVRTNPEVLASANRRFAADQGLRQAQAGYLPRLDLSAGKGREQLDSADTRFLGKDGTTFGRRDTALTLSQMLFDGFAVRSEVARQTARVDASAFGAAATAEDLALRTAATYLEVLRRQETVAAAVANLSAHQRIYDQIRTLTQGGVGRRADFDQAESRLALAKANLRQEQSSLRDAEVSYARLVGAPPQALAAPASPDPMLPASEQEAARTAITSSPAVRSAEADVAVAAALNAGAKAALSPRLDLELAANRGNDVVRGTTSDRTVMLRFRYNFSRGGADTARISETGFLVQEANEELSRIRRQVEESVNLAFNANLTARDRLVLLQQYVAASAATRESYMRQFSIGQRTLLDLLNAENEYFNAQLAYITGQYAQLTSAFRILASMGQLLSSLQIVLPAEVVQARGMPALN